MEKTIIAKYKLLDAMGVAQHHDAVSGTAKQAVTDDYLKMLASTMEKVSWDYSHLIQEKVKD